MADYLTELTKKIGDTLARLKQNNKLVEEFNSTYNPTFVEIMEDLMITDKTLASLLMAWYNSKREVPDSLSVPKPRKAPTSRSSSSPSYGCSSGGCGSSSSYRGGC